VSGNASLTANGALEEQTLNGNGASASQSSCQREGTGQHFVTGGRRRELYHCGKLWFSQSGTLAGTSKLITPRNPFRSSFYNAFNHFKSELVNVAVGADALPY
jgi:hypothetical protein